MTHVFNPGHPLPHPSRPLRNPMVVGLFATLWLAACAGMPPPTEQLAVSTAAVASATAAGAPELAAADLRTARDKLDRANAAVAADHNERALLLASEAQVDARLAEVKARSVKAQKTAAEVKEGNRVLSEEMNRTAK